jgi:hypothetical protein
MHHTCQTPICSDGTVNDHQGRNCDLLTKVVDAHAAELARHTDDVETLQRTLEPHHIASLKLLEDVQLPGAKTAQNLQIASHFAALVNAPHERETELVREVEETCARNSMTLAVQRETLATVASMSSGIEQARRTASLRIRATSSG